MKDDGWGLSCPSSTLLPLPTARPQAGFGLLPLLLEGLWLSSIVSIAWPGVWQALEFNHVIMIWS